MLRFGCLVGGVLFLQIWTVVSSQTLQGKTLKAVSMLIPPYLMLTGDNSQGNDRYKGYTKDLLDRLATDLGFNYTIQLVDVFGNEGVDGNWSGLIGKIVDMEADIAAGPLTVTSHRLRAVKFSRPFMSQGPVIVLKKPEGLQATLSQRLLKFGEPLDRVVWLMIVLAFFTTSTVLYIISYYSPYEWRHLGIDKEATFRESESFTCMNSFWFVLSSLSWQGYTRSPRSVGARTVVLFWWFFVVVFIVTYTASLTNLLRRGPWSNVAKGYTKIHSLKDLAMQSSVEFGVIAKGSTYDYLQESHLAHLQRLWQKISSNKAEYLFDSIEEGIQKVRDSPKSNFAFITEMALAKYFVYQPPCDLSFVSDISIATKSFSFAFDKRFPYLDEIDMALLKLKENDYLQFLDATWFQGGCVEENTVNPREDWSKSLHFTPIDLGYFSGALILLLIGLMLGGAISVVEVIIYKCAESRQSDLPSTELKSTGQRVSKV